MPDSMPGVMPDAPPGDGADIRYTFQITVHAAPQSLRYGPYRELAGGNWRPLDVEPGELTRPMAVSFERACQALDELPRMFCEPDGSFVWRGGPEPGWQVDGVLYDHGGRLLYVELKGECPAAELDRLLAALGHLETPLVFQLNRAGLVLDEPQFRQWAARGEPQ